MIRDEARVAVQWAVNNSRTSVAVADSLESLLAYIESLEEKIDILYGFVGADEEEE